MATIKELESNIFKMQELLKVAQNTAQKKSFEQILENLTKQLEELKVASQAAPETTPQILKVNKPTPPKEVKLESSETKQPVTGESEIIPSDTPQKIFQGVGVIQGRIVKRYEENDHYYNSVAGDKTYPLIINSHPIRLFVKTNYKPDEEQYLLVYPNVVHYPQPKGETKPPKISFTLVAVSPAPYLEFPVNEFKLCGLFQQIAVYRGAVISVHRNKNKEVKKLAEKYEKLAKNIMRANHVPIFWKDAPVKPFRFNPKLDKDKQGSRYFVEIKARFIPNQQKWGFMELLSEPTLEVPRFYKPLKSVPPGKVKSTSQDKSKDKSKDET